MLWKMCMKVLVRFCEDIFAEFSIILPPTGEKLSTRAKSLYSRRTSMRLWSTCQQHRWTMPSRNSMFSCQSIPPWSATAHLLTTTQWFSTLLLQCNWLRADLLHFTHLWPYSIFIRLPICAACLMEPVGWFFRTKTGIRDHTLIQVHLSKVLNPQSR